MIDVAAYAWAFREAILQGCSSERMCVAVSAPLHAALRVLDVHSQLVRADLEQGEHVFLQLPDGQVLDATADQFNAHSRQPLPGVYLGAPTTPHRGARPWPGGQEWHALMTELKRLYPAFAAPEVGRTVGAILRTLPPGLCDFSKAAPACSALVR